MISPDDVVKRALDTRARRIGNMQLIARGPAVKELNEVAAVVWRLADGTRSARQISAQIVAEYEVSPQEALTDVVEFLTEMVDADFMKVRGAA
jgi:Coenzyme PQQ synthesis protein D (PqqD)